MSKRMWWIALACASCAATTKPVATSPATPHTVLVRAMIVEVPPAQVPALAGKDASQIAALPGVDVRTRPSIVLFDHVEGTAAIGCVPASACDNYKLAVTAAVLPHDLVHIDVAVSGDVHATTSKVLHDAQSVVVETAMAAAPRLADGRMFIVLRSDIIHNQDELRRLTATN